MSWDGQIGVSLAVSGSSNTQIPQRSARLVTNFVFRWSDRHPFLGILVRGSSRYPAVVDNHRSVLNGWSQVLFWDGQIGVFSAVSGS